MNSLDHITTAVHRCLATDDSAALDYYRASMTAQDRLRFDYFLVKMNDELAYQAGTCERRFCTRVHRMAQLERERLEGVAR